MSFYSLTTDLGFWSFLNHKHFPSWTHSAANFDQLWQSYMYAETNKQLTCGEFCYLPATLCPFPEKVASQNSTQSKTIKWVTKRAVKKDDKRTKKNARKEYWKQILPPPSRKKKKRQTLSRNARRTKILLLSSNWQKNLLWVLKISFLAIPMLTSQKLLHKLGKR